MIEVKDLTIRFGEHLILENIDLEIRPKEMSIILGQSGCGKSVLMKTIEALYFPIKGYVTIDGSDIHCANPHERKELRKKMSMLFQGSALLDSLNVYQNVALPLREHKNLTNQQMLKIVEENLEMVGLKDILEKMPSQLSGGMKKRVALARAMVLKPSYIIFDEPTTGLDPVTATGIATLIINLFEEHNITPIIVTHDLNLIELLNARVIMLADKKKIFDGSYKKFKISNDKRIEQFLGNIKGE